MKMINRRAFIRNSAIAASFGLAAGAGTSAWANANGANGSLRLAIIGLNNKGADHLKQLLEESDVRIVALCDVDPEVLARAAEIARSKQVEPYTTTDARNIFDRADVDAVIIATGTHWHALLTIWACQAGKDVYVEKPMSRTIWEGRRIVEAAARYQRIVQVGMQRASDPGVHEAAAYLRTGELGKIKYLRMVYYYQRLSIGRRAPWYPPGMDYNIFCGPAPVVPLERNRLHYDWHWMWATGNGDLGNNGVHMVGMALQMTGRTGAPLRVLGAGGRFGIDDVAETPNTMLAVYDYPDFPLIYEQRALPAKPGAGFMDQCHGLRVGVVVTCEGGHLAGMVGATAVDHNGRLIRKFAGDGGAGHMRNFLNAVKSRRTSELAAPPEFGHLAAAMCHLGNISYRVGEAANGAAVKQSVAPIAGAPEIFDEIQDHLAVHDIDLSRQPVTRGQWVHPDAAVDGITRIESSREDDLSQARFLLQETQRPPYVLEACV